MKLTMELFLRHVVFAVVPDAYLQKWLWWWWWCYPTSSEGGSAEELHGDPTVGPRPNVWTNNLAKPLKWLF